MVVIGITGQVGSGKSQALRYLETIDGIEICEADKVGHLLQEKESIGYLLIVESFGTGILDEDGTINRKKFGAIVFAEQEKLELLNKIMHPIIKDYIVNQIARAKQKGVHVFVVEAALLLENNYQDICDEIWYIYTRIELRCERVISSRGYTKDKFYEINATQMQEDVIRQSSDRVICNSEDVGCLHRQIETELERVKKKWQDL